MVKEAQQRLINALKLLKEPSGSTILSIVQAVNGRQPHLSLKSIVKTLRGCLQSGIMTETNGRIRLVCPTSVGKSEPENDEDDSSSPRGSGDQGDKKSDADAQSQPTPASGGNCAPDSNDRGAHGKVKQRCGPKAKPKPKSSCPKPKAKPRCPKPKSKRRKSKSKCCPKTKSKAKASPKPKSKPKCCPKPKAKPKPSCPKPKAKPKCPKPKKPKKCADLL